MSDFNNWWAKASKSFKIGGLRGAGSCCTTGGRAKGLSKCEDKPNDPEIVRNIWHIPATAPGTRTKKRKRNNHQETEGKECHEGEKFR